ncbi:hypothetical protein AGMMS49545_23210 [Betaproteobacteria bacterium]|nr:hypothetical protein AGMMS49545_23210 [Betaproteobacteria bacterium]GHU47376.1 hypothetical protein AGMMS50289_22460 [Betaproteobacteria bacterium]
MSGNDEIEQDFDDGDMSGYASRFALARKTCGDMATLCEERMAKEAQKSQPDAEQITRLRSERAHYLQERDTLREDDDDAHQRIFDNYLPVLQDDEWSEEKITSSGRYELREKAKLACSKMWDVFYGQKFAELKKPYPDQAKIEHLKVEMSKCKQEEFRMLDASVAEQKALIAQYEPLIWAIHQQRAREASAQRTEPEATADAEEAEAMTP